MKKIGILASYNGSGFETIQKAIEDNMLKTFENKIINTHPAIYHQFMEELECMDILFMKL